MTGQLQIFYKNGEIRNVNLTPGFFKETKVTIATRALDIAHSHNPEPWKIFVYKDAEPKFEKIIQKNDPNPPEILKVAKPNSITSVERRRQIKKFKKELRKAA